MRYLIEEALVDDKRLITVVVASAGSAMCGATSASTPYPSPDGLIERKRHAPREAGRPIR
jgi:hypothetical protein